MKRPLFARPLEEAEPPAYDSDFDDRAPRPTKTRAARPKAAPRIRACGLQTLDAAVLACKDAGGRVVVVALTEGVAHGDADEIVHATTRDGTAYARVDEEEPTESEFLGLFFSGRYDAAEGGVAGVIAAALESAQHVVVVDGSSRGLGLARLAACAAAARAGLAGPAKPPPPTAKRYKEAARKLGASAKWWRVCDAMKDFYVDHF